MNRDAGCALRTISMILLGVPCTPGYGGYGPPYKCRIIKEWTSKNDYQVSTNTLGFHQFSWRGM
jgi:hypothetical protein